MSLKISETAVDTIQYLPKSVTTADAWMPGPISYCALGAVVSGAVFQKLSHIVEYVLNKKFGDYTELGKIRDGRIIVSMPRSKSHYFAQSIILAMLVATISSIAVRALVLAGCPTPVAIPLLVGSVATPILMGLYNVVRYRSARHDRWVEISEAEIKERGIDKSKVEVIPWHAKVYCHFGAAQEFFFKDK